MSIYNISKVSVSLMWGKKLFFVRIFNCISFGDHANHSNLASDDWSNLMEQHSAYLVSIPLFVHYYCHYLVPPTHIIILCPKLLYSYLMTWQKVFNHIRRHSNNRGSDETL